MITQTYGIIMLIWVAFLTCVFVAWLPVYLKTVFIIAAAKPIIEVCNE